MNMKFTSTFSTIGAIVPISENKSTLDPQQVLTRLNFGRVDAESDNRFGNCFIGTDILRNFLLPEHSLIIGAKGSGKSAIFRLLCEETQKVRPFLPRGYKKTFCIPVFGLQSEEQLPSGDLREMNPTSIDEFRNFWLIYFGLKTAAVLIKDEELRTLVSKSGNKALKEKYSMLQKVLVDVGIMEPSSKITKISKRFALWMKTQPKPDSAQSVETAKTMSYDFRNKTGISIIALLDTIDEIMKEVNCLAWVVLDKLDLLFVGDYERLKAAIAGAVQLLVEYSNRFKNIHFKIFLRTDIYRQLHIVNKSHLVSYTSEIRWRDSLLLKLLVSRAIDEPTVREYCETVLGEKIDVTSIIVGSDDFVRQVFYSIFQPTMQNSESTLVKGPFTHEWILKRMVDGMGNSYPRELIHLGNLAVARQREYNRLEGRHTSTRLISPRALKESFHEVSVYRCETYLYSEFPHLTKHFNVFRGSDSSIFHREELYMLFEPLQPKGDEAIRAVYDTGLLLPLGKNVDSSLKFKIPLLYKVGLGITDRRNKTKLIDQQVNEQEYNYIRDNDKQSNMGG